jgi:ankyrin
MRTRARIARWIGVPLLSVGCLAASDPRLVDAVKNQDKTIARSLLNQHLDVNAPQGDGATALHWAAYWDDLEIADLLIRAGANVNAANDLGVTPLFLACSNGSETMVAKLLKAGANANTTGPSGESALMAAARTGAAEAVRALLEHGANVNAKERSHGQTALMWAISQRHPAVVKLLIEHGADVHARSVVTQELAYTGVPTVQAGRNAAALVVTVPKGGSTPLLFAARQGDIESAKLLLAAGADVNETAPDQTSVLVMATHSGQGALAAFLLDHGADANAAGAGYTALHAAVLRNDLDLVKALLAHGADPNARITKATPVPRESQEFVLPTPLLGATPFFLASKFAEPDIMRVLAAANADVMFAMKDGTTALMAAAGVGWAFQADRRGALNVAAPTAEDERRGLEAVKVALELGGDVNASNQASDTALHGAAAKGFSTIVQVLVDHGAKLDVKNRRGQTPLAVTPQPRGEGSTAALLRKLGAKE